jgi:hypothetical protein
LTVVALSLSAMLADELLLSAATSFPSASDPSPHIVINEIDYDQPGADQAEFIELKNSGSITINLDPFALDLVNGEGGGAEVYQAIDLPGADIAPGGYYVVCTDVATVANCDLEAPIAIQHDGPDAIALLLGTVVIDTVSYEGDTGAPYTEGSGNGLQDLGVTGYEYSSISRLPDGVDTEANNSDFGLYCITPGEPNSAGTVPCSPPFGACDDRATFIHDIQGSGAASPMEGDHGVIIQGVVVGDFQDAAIQLGGFFVQEEDAQADTSLATSEGIFVYEAGLDVTGGDVVRVQGYVAEFSGLTELTNITHVAVCSSSSSVAATEVVLPVGAVTDLESFEGMLVTFPETLFATDTSDLGQYGEVSVSVNGRQFSPTQVAAPGAAANALQDLNGRSRIMVDDASNTQNPATLPYLAPDNTLRLGDTVENLTGVLSFGLGHYRLQPPVLPTFNRANPRPVALDDAGGTFAVASFNLLNYFNGDGQGGGFPTSRGAHTLDEFERQRAKIIEALVALDADVVGLVEIENDGYGRDSAISDLVNALNVATSPDTYAFVNPGVDQIGADEIAVGFIYKPATVAPVGSASVLDSTVDPLFNDAKNCPALAQSFEHRATGERFTAALNHFKSKGTACDDVGDPDTGDGQGNCNVTRTKAAVALAAWLAKDPTGSGDPDFLLLGDLNSYAQEDPVAEIKSAGYTDLVDSFVGDRAYSYVHAGQAGYLDHALANKSLASQVVGTTIWHINADEPRALDYNDDRLDSGEGLDSVNPAYLYMSDAYRSSSHDPILVSLDLVSPRPELSLAKAVEPASSVPLEGTVTFTIQAANSGEQAASGVTLTDVLPPEVDFAAWIAAPAGTSVDSDTIAWQGDLGAGETLTWIFEATVAAPYGATVVNTAAIERDGSLSQATATFTLELAPITGLALNELDYDQPAVDDAEFIEIANVGDTGVTLSRCRIDLVNGATGSAYRTVDLPDASLAPGDYYVVCGNARNVSACDLEVSPSTNLIQNGAPDSVVLVCDGTIVDSVAYEGDAGPLYTEGSGVGLEDDPGGDGMGISRCPDGIDTGQNNVDLSLHGITPGEANNCLSLPALSLGKTVAPASAVHPGDSVVYTILLTNHGEQAAVGVTLTDALPPEVGFVGWIRAPGNATIQDGVISWHGDVGAAQTLTWILSAKAIQAYSSAVVNTAAVEYGSDRIEATAEFGVEAEPVTGVIITEIMQNPQAVADSAGEWLELHNANSAPVDLHGCILRDDGTNSHAIGSNGPLVIGPGEYLVLGRSVDPAQNGGVPVAYTYDGFLLVNSADEVVLECNGQEVDRVNYDDGTTFPNPVGASMQLVDPGLDNNVGSNWCEAMTPWPGAAGDRGTPGSINNCSVLPALSITKAVTTAHDPVPLGEPVTYTVVLANGGNADAGDVLVTDRIPAGVIGDDLNWRGTVRAGDQIEFTIPATVSSDAVFYGATITNTAVFSHTSGSGSGEAVFAIESVWRRYYPLFYVNGP